MKYMSMWDLAGECSHGFLVFGHPLICTLELMGGHIYRVYLSRAWA